MTKHRDNQPDDDATVWKRLTDGVKAYRPDPPAPIRPKSSPAAPRRRGRVAAAVARPAAVTPTTGKPDPVDLRAGEHAGIDKSTRRRFAQGQMAIDSRLDLHGLTALQAERRLASFIDTAVRLEYRCVLVITGKGADGTGVLRRLVPQWLKSSPLAPRVLAISAARPGDGGEGALYVLLRRRRRTP
ncbi:MAG: Smr/MutS family protein [Candidatus Puniceispirillaceae bacterium]